MGLKYRILMPCHIIRYEYWVKQQFFRTFWTGFCSLFLCHIICQDEMPTFFKVHSFKFNFWENGFEKSYLWGTLKQTNGTMKGGCPNWRASILTLAQLEPQTDLLVIFSGETRIQLRKLTFLSAPCKKRTTLTSPRCPGACDHTHTHTHTHEVIICCNYSDLQ